MVALADLNKILSYMAYRIFKPLVVFFLRNSIPYQTASDWLKRIYVDTALENKEFRINPDKKQTKTRVAVLTGLSRVEIDRVLKITKPIEVTEQKFNRATKVISAWSNNANFLDSNQNPRVLPLHGELSFNTLVEKSSGGATMRSILDELLNVKSVELLDNKVNLIRKDYSQVPDKQRIVNLELFGMYSGDLLNTLVFNDKETDKDKKKFQKIVIGWSIPKKEVSYIKKFIYEETDKLLISIDKEISKISTNNGSAESYKLGLGTYYFEEENHEEK